MQVLSFVRLRLRPDGRDLFCRESSIEIQRTGFCSQLAESGLWLLRNNRKQQVPSFYVLAGCDVDFANAAGHRRVHIRLHLHGFEREELGMGGHLLVQFHRD